MPFEIFKSEKSDKYYFRLRAKNGQIILQSEGYEQKAGAEAAIQSVKSNTASADNFEKKESKNGQHYFSLKADNGSSLGRSQMYKSTSGRNNGIKSVMTNAANAEVKDLS